MAAASLGSSLLWPDCVKNLLRLNAFVAKDLAAAACLGVPGLFGAFFGLNVASKLPESKLRLGFAGCIV